MTYPIGTRQITLHGISRPTQIIHPHTVFVYSLECQFHRLLAIFGCTHRLVSIGNGLFQIFLILSQDAGAGNERLDGGLHTLFVRLVDMVFDEQAQSVARCHISFRIARIENVNQDAAFRRIILTERCIKEKRESYLFHTFVELLFIHIERPLAQAFFHDGTTVFDGVGHHILEIGSIGDMHIDEQLRHPTVIELQPSTHFRCISLQEVTIEVDELGGITGTQFFRTILIDTVGCTEILVSVYIEDRDKQEAHMIQDIDVLFLYDHVAKEYHAGILSIRFTGMDTRFNQNNHTTFLTDLNRILQTILIHYHQ